MKIWGLADFHLHGEADNPMLKYDSCWQDHKQQLDKNIRALVGCDDLLLVPGDITMATDKKAVLADLDFVAALPGRKVLGKGNHDFWWESISKVRKMLPEGVYAIQNDFLIFDDVAIAGTRGWNIPGLRFPGFMPEFAPSEAKLKHQATRDDAAIYAREVGRLRMSLQGLRGFTGHKIAMLHFPPTNHLGAETAMTEILEEQGVSKAVFGHLHSLGQHEIQSPLVNKAGVDYHLVSADYVGFVPQLLLNL